MFKDPLRALRTLWFIGLFLAAILALPSLLAGLWFEAVAKFLLVMSMLLLGLKVFLHIQSEKSTDQGTGQDSTDPIKSASKVE
ncbi:MAG: hypothetical protein AB7I41_24775 [Candidatus Sericytochromatia bacterium]